MTVKATDNGHKATAHADTGARDAGAAETVESQRTDTQRSDVSAQSKPSHRTALIDVGGGFRAIFGAGVMDRCQEEGITFDHCYGVSAGSANMVSFLAGQHGRNHKFYTEYAFRKEYASFDSYVKHHNLRCIGQLQLGNDIAHRHFNHLPCPFKSQRIGHCDCH